MNFDNLHIENISELDLESSVEDSFELDLESGSDSDLGIQLADDVDIDVSDEDIVFEDSSEDLSDTLLLSTTVNVIETLKPYVSLINAALMSIYPEGGNKQETGIQWAVDHAEFRYMPHPVFSVMCKILQDMVADDSLLNMSVQQLVDKSLEQLLEATGWSPTINKEAYTKSYGTWVSKYRKISHAKKAVPVGDIASLVTRKDLITALYVYTINTATFEYIDSFAGDPTKTESDTFISTETLGNLTHDYMEANQLRRLTVRDAYIAVVSYLSSPEVIASLGLTSDDALILSTGELLRRLIVYEFDNGFFAPYILRDCGQSDFAKLIEMLTNEVKSGSIAAEIITILAMCINACDPTERNDLARWFNYLFQFLRAAIDDSRLVHPTFYTKVVKTGDTYTLSYVAGNTSHDTKTDGTLCEIVGNKSCIYVIPLVHLSEGHTVCPPASLVNTLRSSARVTHVKVGGNMAYKYVPSIAQIASSIIAEDHTDEAQTAANNAMHRASSSLLQLLLQYNNKFYEDDGNAVPVVIETNGYHICAIKTSSDAATITAVTTDTELVASDGTLVFDENTGNLLVSFVTKTGDSVDIVSEPGKFEEQYLGTASDTADELPLYLSFIGAPNRAKVIEYSSFRAATSELCSLASLDYEEELRNAKRQIASYLFYEAHLFVIDNLFATVLLRYHVQYAKAQGALDRFNAESVRDLISVICPDEVSALDLSRSDAITTVETLVEKYGVDIDKACDFLDALDTNTLTLVALSQNVLDESRMDVYDAICYIPEIGSRFAVLEDKLVALHVFDILDDQSPDVFRKYTYMFKLFGSQITADNVDELSRILVSKSKKKSVKCALDLCSKIVKSENNADAAVLKYFILERRLYGLLSTMSLLDQYPDFYQSALAELGLESLEGLDESKMDRFVEVSTRARFFNSHKGIFHRIVVEGLYAEAASRGMHIIKAFDLFASFFDLIVPYSVELPDQVRAKDTFYTYAGSFLLSYCPVSGTAVGGIEGGEDRVNLFLENQEDFHFSVPLTEFCRYPISDIRFVAGD